MSVGFMLYVGARTAFAVDLASAAEERDGCRDNVCGVQAWPSIPMLLYRVAELLPTILFIPDQFGRLLRFRAQRQQPLIFQFLPTSAGQSVGPRDAACLRDMTCGLV